MPLSGLRQGNVWSASDQNDIPSFPLSFAINLHRSFDITPDGLTLVVVGASSETVEVFAIDQIDGTLTKIREEIGPVGGSIIVAIDTQLLPL